MLGHALAHQGFAIVPDRDRGDVDQAEVLEGRLVDLVLRADDRAGNAIAPAEHLRGLGAVDERLGGVDIWAILQGHPDELVFLGRRDVRRQDELSKRLRDPGRFGDSNLVAEVGQGGDIILLCRADQLAGGPALDLRQHDVGGGDLIGLEAMLEGFLERVVKLGKLSGDPEPLAPVLGRLEESVGLDDRQKLCLDHGPFLLLVGRLGHVIAVRCLMTQLDRLAKRHIEVELTDVIKGSRLPAAGRAAEWLGRDQGDGSKVDP